MRNYIKGFKVYLLFFIAGCVANNFTTLILMAGLQAPQDPMPDLRVSSFSVEPAKVGPGEKVSLLYAIVNIGQRDIRNKKINYSFYLSKNQTLDSSDLRILSIDKSGFTLKSGKAIAKKGFVWRMPSLKKLKLAGISLKDPVWYILLVIDRKNWIKEEREDNNIGRAVIRPFRR